MHGDTTRMWVGLQQGGVRPWLVPGVETLRETPRAAREQWRTNFCAEHMGVGGGIHITHRWKEGRKETQLDILYCIPTLAHATDRS